MLTKLSHRKRTGRGSISAQKVAKKSECMLPFGALRTWSFIETRRFQSWDMLFWAEVSFSPRLILAL
jgi:hypothetical protein